QPLSPSSTRYSLAGGGGGAAAAGYTQPGAGQYTTPTADEIARWSAPEVQTFRSQFAKFFFVNVVIVIAAILTSTDFITITVIWSIFMALKYSKLWSAGYDWHDVFREPRERPFTDVLQEGWEHVEDFFNRFDKKKRGKVRSRSRKREALRGGAGSALPPEAPMLPGLDSDYGDQADVVRRAGRDRDEILRIVAALPRSDQSLVDGVIPAAEGLYRRTQGLAAALREAAPEPGAADRIEQEIATLEAQANPLDVPRSEERVRRLALLKRERRTVADVVRRREATAAKLESCALALQNMRIDLLRLRAGGVAGASQHITLLTERARSLADEVDAVVHGEAESRVGAVAMRGAGERGGV
ncbi:MAG TPA: hypothetical protein VIQ74_17570, partial [Gemmatimonadaceae bacterium]